MTPRFDPRLDEDSTALLVIDAQEKLAAAMPESDRIRCIRKIGILIDTARILDIPVLVSEQYPKGLGPTVPELRSKLDAMGDGARRVEKLSFAGTASSDFVEALDHLVTHHGDGAIRTVLATGMESHICVYQTVRGLLGGGFHVQVPWDATCSRSPLDVDVARSLWAHCGAVVTSTETVVFDLLGSAEHPHFKAVSKLIR